MKAKQISQSTAYPAPGQILNRSYVVVRELHSGDYAHCLLARPRKRSDSLVVIKLINYRRAIGLGLDLQSELACSCAVNHPNVVFVRETFRQGSWIGMVMDYVDGGDLASAMTAQSGFSVYRTVKILSQLCAGIHAIHQAGFVHRDLKPENVLLTKTGRVKIADLGIARPAAAENTEMLMGTPDYMPPEYILSGQIDLGFDLYSLGVIAYELITGRLPFAGLPLVERVERRMQTDPPPPSSFNSQIPPELDRIVLKALARCPSQRYRSAAEFTRDLQGVRQPTDGFQKVARIVSSAAAAQN